MEPERAELYEGLAQDTADVVVAALRILGQVFVRVMQGMPFEEWFGVYMEEQGYRQEEFRERFTRTHEEFSKLSPDEGLFVLDMILQKAPKKLERLEIPEPLKGFFLNLLTLIKPAILHQTVYECDECQQQFMVPQEDFDKVSCPRCGKQWKKEELPGTSG